MKATCLMHIGDTDELRIDPHFSELLAEVKDLADNLTKAHPLAEPFFPYIRNGENLPAVAYIRDGQSTNIYYASVGALSQFVLRPEACIPLKTGPYLEERSVAHVRTTRNEVLLTRSGTPGIAWTADLAPQDEISIIPSGFLIRLGCDPSYYKSGYVAAILNHPLWRLWSSAFAAGKRQRNLSQDHLNQIFVPIPPLEVQNRIAECYQIALDDVSEILTDQNNMLAQCDGIIETGANLSIENQPRSLSVAEKVDLRDVSGSDILRVDHRFLRADYRAIQRIVQEQPHTRLIECMSGPPIRNSQPHIEVVDYESGPRIIATGSLQMGQVVESLTKRIRVCAPLTGAQARLKERV
jgi:hypothetical protein